jgi:hypothetical protein
VRMPVGAARPVLAAERQSGGRLVDQYRPIVHDELRQRPRGDAALLDADRSVERSTNATEHTDCVLAQSVNAQHAGSGHVNWRFEGGVLRAHVGREGGKRGQAAPCHREHVGRQQQPCCRRRPLRPRRCIISVSQPCLRTRQHTGSEPSTSIHWRAGPTRTCTRFFRRVDVHRSSRGRAARAATAPGVCENSFKSLLLSSGGRFDSRTCRLF